jgi:DNA polymerase III subunit alpha
VTEQRTSSIPFVGLHAHSGLSPFDGLGMPAEHMEFAYENGMTAHSLTDHGHMNGLPYQVEHLKKMRESGKEFKAIYGCEAYFIPSHRKWRAMYEENKKNTKSQKKEEFKMVVEEENKGKRKFNPLNNRSHLVIVAQNQVGLNNLFQLVSDSYRPENFYRYPRMDFEMLEKYNEGLIVSSACLSGVFANDYWRNRDKSPEHVLEAMRQTGSRFKEIFGDRFYGEIQWNDVPEQHALNDFVIQTCIELGIEVISTADSHYPRPELWKDREMYKRIGWGGKAPAWGEDANTLPESVEDIGYELYPKNGDQMWESYKRYSSASKIEYEDDYVLNSITRTHDIAYDRIEDFLPDTTVRLPEFVIPEGKTATQALTEMAVAGLKDKGVTSKEYVDRLKYELEIITDRGFAQYFLTMKAISDKAQEMMLVGLGRGSAAGSLLSYVLDITQIDPIKYNLQFERFLTKTGSGYPDIDFDVEARMDLIRSLQDDWGETTVVPISNFNTLQLRSLIKDLGKFYDVPFMEVNKVTGVMMDEATPKAKSAHGMTAGVYVPTFDEVKEYSETLQDFFEKYPQIATHVDALYGNMRSVSRHAGGTLIAENLDHHMPLINSGGTIQTPWSEGQNVRHLEPLGFIKFDLLGLSTLRMISGAIRHILRRHKGIEDPTFEQVKLFYNENLHPDVIDFDDQEVWKNIFQKGRWAGVFQMTNSGAQNFCREAQPTSLLDFAAVTAIFRPGPLSAGAHKLYVANKENPLQVTYDHPVVEEVLAETHGLLVFQEQLATLAHKIGEDLSLDEGNLLRKVLTKKGTGKDDIRKAIYEKFIRGGKKKGLTDAQLNQIWANMEYFSGYGFNLSHAVAYGAVSYQCAWLLNYYECEWMAAFLDAEPEKKKMSAINTAKSFGYEITSPSINNSGRVWEISKDGKTLIQPLAGIKGLGDSAVDQIINNRPFNSIEDFIFSEDIVYSKLNKKALDILVRSQALDELMDERFTGMKHFWSAVAVERPRKEKNLLENIELYAPEGDFSPEERLENFASLTGIFPLHEIMPIELQMSLLERGCPPVSEYDPELKLVWFVPREVKVKKTKNGKPYWIIKTTDSNSFDANIRCWGVKDTDRISLNKVYVANLDHNEKWGFSTRSISRSFRRLS